jgi:hypothetical protein
MREIHKLWNRRRDFLMQTIYLRPGTDAHAFARRELPRWTWMIRREIAVLRFQMTNPQPK